MLLGIVVFMFGLYLLLQTRFDMPFMRHLPVRFIPRGTYVLRERRLHGIGCAYMVIGILLLMGILHVILGLTGVVVCFVLMLLLSDVVPVIHTRRRRKRRD